MPSRRLPNSIPSVLRTLQVARREYKNTADPAERAITADQWARLTDTGTPPSFLTRFEAECGDVDAALARQMPLTGELARKMAAVTLIVSHFHQVLDFAIARGRHAEGIRRYYGREGSATKIPDLATQVEAEAEAGKIVAGEARRATEEGAAFVPMANPSAGDVEAALAALAAARNASDTADRATNREREEAMALYPEAQALAVDICDTVEFFYRKDPSASSRREKCRRWGVVYVFGAGETPDPDTGGGGGGNPPQG